jgi:phage minor structural protein
MEYATDGKHVEDLGYNKIILAKPSQENTLQAFRIYKIEKSVMSGTITVNAQHISYQLANIPLKPFAASSLADALVKLKSESLEVNPFTFTTDKTSAVACGSAVPIMCRSMLGGHEGSLLDVYGGEWKFDNYTCGLLDARGADRGVTIRYGKNLVSLEQEESIANTITGIVPFWQASDSNECVYADPVYASTASNFPYKRT